MKTALHYSAKITLCVRALGITARIDLGYKSLDDTLEYVDCIFNNATMFHGEKVDCIYVVNSDTGELITECHPDPKNSNEDNYDSDWDYNENLDYGPCDGDCVYDY